MCQTQLMLNQQYGDDDEEDEEKKIDPGDPYEVLSGECKYDACIPFNNFSFSNVWEQYNAEQIADIVNQNLDSPEFLTKKIKAVVNEEYTSNGLENRWNNVHKVKLIAIDDIENNELLYSVKPFQKLITESGKLNFELFEPQSKIYNFLKNEKIPELEVDPENAYTELFGFTYSLLIHFYNFEHSKLKAELLSLPSSLSHIPIFSLTKHEFYLLALEESKQTIMQMRSTFKITYKDFMNKIQSTINKKQLDILFNSRFQDIKIQDYIYCMFLQFSISPFSVLPSIFSLAVNPSSLESIYKSPFSRNFLNRDGTKVPQKNQLFNITSTQQFLKGDKIVMHMYFEQSPTRFAIGLVNNEKHLYDCMETFVLGNETAKLYDHPISYCLNKPILYHFFALCTLIYLQNLIHMKAKDFASCTKFLKQSLSTAYNVTFNKVKDQLIYNECIHPEWGGNDNIMNYIIFQLNTRIDGYLNRIRRFEDYLEFRRDNELPSSVAAQIILYLKQRLYLCETIVQEAKNYIKLNKKFQGKILVNENLEEEGYLQLRKALIESKNLSDEQQLVSKISDSAEKIDL